MTRKDFVLDVTTQLVENPRAVLAGHGIPAGILTAIGKRPDVMSKLATVLYSMKSAKMGAKGLKKSPVFGVKGYKTFAELNTKARADIEKFIGGLPTTDSNTFSNSENIITICMLPDTKGMVTGKELDEVEEAIITGKSVMLSFDSAVRKEYKIPGGQYVVVMIGDSAVRPAEEKLALRKDKVNARKVAKRTPAKIKASLRKKANASLSTLADKRARMQQQRYVLGAEMQQQRYMLDELGDSGDDLMYGIGKANMSAQAYQINRSALVATLSAEDRAIYNAAEKLISSGKKTAATAVINTISDAAAKQKLRALVNSKTPMSGTAKVDARKKALRTELNKLRQRGEKLLVDLSLAPAQKRTSIKSMISKNNSAIKVARTKLGTYKNMSDGAKVNKAMMMQQLNANIEANIAKGNSISQALNVAIAKLDATPAQKQVLKQQVMEQVADGMPMQFAAQQAIQDLQFVGQQLDSTLSGTYDIEELLANI